ncbi:MAG: GAF and ANTAR domain-containing protein [Actinomycetota bacterium]
MSNSGTAHEDPPGWPWGDDLCRPFVDLLPVTGVSISVIGRSARRVSLCASDSVAARLECLQFELGEGPQWVVMLTGEPSLNADLSPPHSANWPIFGACAAQLGVAAVFAFPITMGAVTVGAIDLYRRTPGELDPASVALAQSLAIRVAATAVHAAIRAADQESPLEPAGSPTMRREVHQATGMILAQLETTATEAFSLLRAHAFASGRGVEDVAKDVVARQLDFRRLSG